MSMTHEEMIAVIQAHKDGKTIQFKRRTGSDFRWEDSLDLIGTTAFNFATLDYRVKPEPREWWLSVDASGFPQEACKSSVCARDRSAYGLKPIHVREVLE